MYQKKEGVQMSLVVWCVTFAATVCVYDVWFYVMHRCMHTKYMYRFHKKHHEYVHSCRAAATHGTWVDNTLTSAGPMWLLLAPWCDLWAWAAAIIFVFLRGFVLHCPIWCQWGIFRRLYGDHHLRHHLNGRNNFGVAWLDTLFSTRAQR